jgi:uncharacterized protein (DUF2345 family)
MGNFDHRQPRCQLFTPPPLNAWVFGFFIDGRDAQQPMILGLIPSQASELVDPNVRGWGAVPAENYDRESQGARPRDLGLSPMSRLATGEFLNETYNEALETNRVRNIPSCRRMRKRDIMLWVMAIFGAMIIGETADGNQITGVPISPSAPPGTPITQDEANSLWSQLEQREAQRRASVGLPTRFNDAERRSILGILASEGGDPGGNLATMLNRSYQSKGAPINQVVFATNQFTPAAAASTGVRDVIAGSDLGGARRFVGGYTSSPTSLLRLAVNGYEPLRAQGVNYFNAASLGARQGTPVLNSGNLYQVGGPGNFAGNGDRNFELFLNRNNLKVKEDTSSQPIGPQLLDDPSQPNRVQQAQLDEQRLGRANELTTEISRLEQERDKLGTTGVDATARDQLNEQIRQKEAELAALDTSNPTQGTAGEPYSGYANPSNAPGCVSSWEEPPSGYSARYPYNRVIETASGHSIELDDTPGGERIMIWHRDGSYVQITGTSTTHKNMSDAYHINERNNHVYIGGNNIVTIEGDSYVLIKGDKVEEIEGNYKQIVHGNVQIGGGGRVEINGADRTDIRSASLSLDSNVENLNIRTGKNIVFESGESFNVKSKNVRLGATENMSVTGQKGLFLQSQGGDIHVKSDGNVFLNPDQNLFLRTEGGTISAEAKGSIRFNSSGSFISINSNSYMSLGSKGEMLIGSEGGSLNLNSSDKMGITASDLFLNGSSDVNVTGGQNVNLTGGSDLNVKAGGAAYISAGAVLNLLAGSDARLTGSNVHVKGSTVFIDDIVQLANGSAVDAVEAESADKKEPIDPSRFGDGTGELGGETAAQAQQAQLPVDPQSEALGIPTPPARSAPIPNVIPRQPTNQSSGNPIVNREATIPGALSLSETTIIGTFGTPQSARTLIRTPEGRVDTFRVGDIIQGRSIISINPLSGEVTFQGENAFSTRTLRVPQ